MTVQLRSGDCEQADRTDRGGYTAPFDYPDPRRAPWPGFALAAEAAVRQLHERLGLDLAPYLAHEAKGQ